ncbi:MAG: FAD-binding oxidoreductase [Gemmatimonadota bacterium]
MSAALIARLGEIAGPASVEKDPRGLPRVAPDSEEALALVCREAHAQGWRIRIEGRGSWLPADAPADFALSTRSLDRIVAVSAANLVATIQAGASFERVRRALHDAGLWLAIDPPGNPERTLGSVVATSTAGPLRQGFGPVRDHVLGLNVVTGDGRVLQAGGRVVKNVAGYDLTKLQVGGFGAFGIVTTLHFRLRALLPADATLLLAGARDRLTLVARELVATGIPYAALELFSPALAAGAEWTLAVRLMGAPEAIEPEAARLIGSTSNSWHRLTLDRATSFWSQASRGILAGAVTIRLGSVLDGLDELLDLLHQQIGEGLVSAGAGSGSVRWSGTAGADRIRELRRLTAAREIPLTLERAPWDLRRRLGHFGAYREGVGLLVGRLREAFDPTERLQVAIEGSDGD